MLSQRLLLFVVLDSQSSTVNGCICIIDKNCNKTAALQPNKITMVHEFYDIDHAARVNFVNYYIHVVHDGNTDPTLILFVMKLISVSVDT
jgi:hypothetical protein